MALTSTTLVAAIDSEQTEFAVTSGDGFAVGYLLKVNDEFMAIKAVSTAWIRVERGQEGTLARDHGKLSIAVVGLPEDFPPETPYHMYTYGAAGAITPEQGLHTLKAASAAAMTLAAPTADQEGVRLLLVAGAAYAYTVALDSGAFNGGTDTALLQFGGAIGDCVELVAIGGSWCIVESKNQTAVSLSPSVSPSKSASASASVSPSKSASVSPSVSGSATPSVSPSKSASVSPSVSQSASPSVSPSASPSVSPSASA